MGKFPSNKLIKSLKETIREIQMPLLFANLNHQILWIEALNDPQREGVAQN